MSCQVKTNQNNKIVNVLAENGEHSFLFERINSLPFIGNKEDALKYYMYAIKKIKNRKDVLLDENGEPILAFKPNSTKTEYYNINGVVLEDSFESARKQDFQKKGVQLGFLSSKNTMEEQILKGGRSVQDSEFAKILDKTESIQRTMFSNGEVKYATPQENNFIIFDTIQRDVDKTSFAGFIETLQDSGLELNETEESVSEDYTIEDISPTEKSIITIDGKKEVLRLKRYKDGYKVVGKQATQKSAYLNAQKLLNGTEIYYDNLTPNTKRVWEKLVREGKAISVENGFVLKGTKAKEISGTINIGGATLEYGERINFVTDEPTGEIELKLVTSENKGRGEAKKTIEEFLQRTDKVGRDTYLAIFPQNKETTDEGLIRLYESFGYVLEPTGFEMIRKARKPQFQIIGEQSAKRINIEEATNEIISKLKENGVAEEVFQLSTQEMLDKLKELDVSDEVAFQIADYLKNGFYSNANVAIGNLKDKNPKTPQQWIKTLTDVNKNGGIRNVGQELNWIGLEDFLNEQEGKSIPFEVVQQYIKDNQIEIVDVSKGGILSSKFDQEKYDDIEWQLNNFFEDGEFEPNEYNKGLDLLNSWRDNPNNSTFQAVVDFWNKQADSMNGQREDLRITNENTSLVSDDTKYSGYQLKGGENYREVLLMLPNKTNKKLPTGYKLITKEEYKQPSEWTKDFVIIDENGDSVVSDNDKDEVVIRFFKTHSSVSETSNYNSSHWEESNILAHIRLNERTLSNGERVLFIEEVQSDWAQDGKKKGFSEKKKGKFTVKENAKGKFDVITPEGEVYGTFNREIDAVSRIKYDNTSNERGEETVNRGVPNMPYKKTDQWVGMTMRRVMQMATQQGFDRVAFITGEQSAERYKESLQLEVSKIEGRDPKGRGDKSVMLYDTIGSPSLLIYVDTEGKVIDTEEDKRYQLGSLKGKPLSEVIGKDAAEQSLKLKDKESLNTKDIKVNSEGMKTFYNSILPKVAKKEAQRFDKKATVDVVDFRNQFDRISDKGLYNEYKYIQSKGEWDLGEWTLEGIKENREGFLQDLEDVDNKNDLTGVIGKQLSIKLTPKLKQELQGAIPQFSKALSEKGVKMLPKGFVFNEKYNPTKLLNILIEKGEIKKIC